MKRLIIAGLVLSLVLYASSVFAAAGWGNYYVKATGPYSTAYKSIGQLHLIKLVSVNGGSATYFRLAEERQDKFLAVALSAMSSGAPVRVYIEKLFSNGHWSDYVVTSMFMGETVEDLN